MQERPAESLRSLYIEGVIMAKIKPLSKEESKRFRKRVSSDKSRKERRGGSLVKVKTNVMAIAQAIQGLPVAKRRKRLRKLDSATRRSVVQALHELAKRLK
jgi:hypothetical protein